MSTIHRAAAATALAATAASAQIHRGPVPAFGPLLDRASVVVPQSRVFSARGSAVQIARVAADIAILEGTARTALRIELFNPGPRQDEAVLLLPVPAGAAVGQFAFAGSAAEPTARLLPADEARATYDEIVNRLRDPALLEFAGSRLIRTSVFPVPAGGKQELRLAYEVVLATDGDRFDYLLPRSESLQQPAPWSITVDVQTKAPLAMVYSPSHELETLERGPRRHRLRLAPGHERAPGSFRLAYLVEPTSGPAASLFAYPDPRIGGGYFLLLAGVPAAPGGRPAIQREVTVVLDRSGSMAGAKLEQARAAALQVIEALEPDEPFNVIDYATTVEKFAPRPVAKSPEAIAAVREYLAGLRPMGGTNIHDALLEALRQPRDDAASLPIVLFLTDGLPTVGQTVERAIGEMVTAGNAHRRRLFTFGVGHDVNAPLLDRIAESTRAASTYVLPDEDVELKVASVFRKLSGPILESPALATLDAAGEVTTRRIHDLYPGELPDIFDGDSLVVLGQYRGDEPLRFELRGASRDRQRRFRFDLDPGKASTRNGFVPRLWASRRVAHLVDEIRQAGADTGMPQPAGFDPFRNPRLGELRDEIMRLSTEFGVLSEYTSFLATEGTELGNWNELVGTCTSNLQGKAWATRTGAFAVNQAINLKVYGKQQQTLNPRNCFYDGNLDRVEIGTVQQVCDRAFFKRGTRWIDGRLVQAQTFTPARTVELGSDAHRELLARLTSQGRQGTLSLTGEILLLVDGEVIAVRN